MGHLTKILKLILLYMYVLHTSKIDFSICCAFFLLVELKIKSIIF